jgi:predicted acyl esterase
VLLLRWFDHWLKETDTGIMEMPGALVQDQRGQWHEEDALEPSRAVTTRFYPAEDGSLTPDPIEGGASFVDNGLGVDPRGACFYVGVGWILGCAPAQPATATFFQTAPYEEEVRFSGVGAVRLRLSHSAPHGRVGVTLYDIDGEKWKPLTYGYSSLNLRDGNEYEFRPITPGDVFTHELELIARDFVLPAGHRLGVAIGSQVDMNPKGLGGNGFNPVPSGGTTEVDLGPETFLELDLLPGSTPVIAIP